MINTYIHIYTLHLLGNSSKTSAVYESTSTHVAQSTHLKYMPHFAFYYPRVQQP